MREEQRKIIERNIFTLTIEELEEGERPGWLKRMVVVIDGEKVEMRFDVEWHISKYRAKWEILKLHGKSLYHRYVTQ